MRAGVLVVDIAANVARLQKDMQDAKGVVASAMGDISRSVNVAKTALGALGVGFSVYGVGRFAQSVIDSADALSKLSQKTGIATGELSQLQYAAGLSGVSTEALSKGVKGLSQRMTEAVDSTSKAGQLMKALGVDINAGATPAIEAIARTFAQLPDGTTKAALAVEIFGKAGMDMIPMLNMGEAGIRALKEEAQRLGLTMSTETAKAAEAFNDNLAAVKKSGEGAAIAILNELSPAMVRITQAMKEAAQDSGVLKAVWIAMGGVAAEALGLNDSETKKLTANLRRAQEEVAKLGAHIDALRKQDLLSGVVTAGNMIEGSFLRANAQLRLTQNLLDAMAGKYDDQVTRSQQRGRVLPGGVDERGRVGTDVALEARLKQLLGSGPDDKKAKSKSLGDLLNESAGVSKDFYQDLQTLHAGYTSGRITLDQYSEAVARLIEKQSFAKELTKAQAEETRLLVEQAQRQVEQQEKQDEILANLNSTMSAHAQELELETSLVGASAAEREKAIEFRKIDLALEKAMVQATPETIDALYERAAAEKARLGVLIDTKVAREKAAEAAKDAAKAWEDEFERTSDVIERSLTDALMRGFEGGKGWAQSFKDALVNMFKTLVLRPIIQPIAQTAAGGVLGAFGVSAQAATGGGLLGGGGTGGGGGLRGGGGLADLMPSFYDLSSLGNTLLGSGGSVNYAINSALGLTGAATWGLAEEAAALGIGGLGVAGQGLASGLSFAGPLIGGAIQALQGNVAGGIGSAIGGIAGSAFGPIGTVAGSFLGGVIGGMFGKKKKKPPHAKIVLQMDEQGRFWADLSDVAGVNQVVENNATFQALNAALNDPLQYDPDVLRSLTGKTLQGERGGTGESLLPKFQEYLAPAAQAAQVNVATWQSKLAATGGGALASGIAGYVGSMSVSEYLSPERRLAGARTMYENALALAGTGDAGASAALPGLAQGLLGAGRDYYASGPQFQSLFERVNSDLARVLDQQASAQEAVLAEMPAALREANQDMVMQLKALREDLKAGLERLNSGLRQMGGSESFGGAPA